MESCEQASEALVDAVVSGQPEPEAAVGHLTTCSRCANEFAGLRRTWQALGALPEANPGDVVRARLLRRVRRAAVWEVLCTWNGWGPAVVAAAVGAGLSLGLTLLVPYDLVVSLCQQLLQRSEAHVGPYLVAGAAYGLPLAAGAWVWRRRAAPGGVIGTLEASVLFLAILVPIAALQCREFGPAQQAAFVWGLAGGAVIFGLAGLGLTRLVLRVRTRPGRA
jgi:hypothetical protein